MHFDAIFLIFNLLDTALYAVQNIGRGMIIGKGTVQFFSFSSIDKKALNFIYLEHFSNFGSTSKKDALRILPKVILNIKSKYLYIGLIRLLFDWRK